MSRNVEEETGKKPSQDLEIRYIDLPRNFWVFFIVVCLFLIGTSVRLEERKHDSSSVTLWPLSLLFVAGLLFHVYESVVFLGVA